MGEATGDGCRTGGGVTERREGDRSSGSRVGGIVSTGEIIGGATWTGDPGTTGDGDTGATAATAGSGAAVVVAAGASLAISVMYVAGNNPSSPFSFRPYK